jgi:hypothetical protein
MKPPVAARCVGQSHFLSALPLQLVINSHPVAGAAGGILLALSGLPKGLVTMRI